MGQLGPVWYQFLADGSSSTPPIAVVEPQPVPAPPTGCARIPGIVPLGTVVTHTISGADMSKRARKRRSRKGNAANHGRKPNA